MTRIARIVFATLGVLILGTGPALDTAAGAGAPDAKDSPRGSISLRGQPAWSRLGDDVTLRLGVDVAPNSGLEVRISIHRAVTSRIAFERTLAGEQLGSEVDTIEAPVELLPVVGADRVVPLPLQDPEATRDPARIRLVVNGAAGVFPVAVELIDPESTDVVDSFVTHLVVTTADDLSDSVTPLRVSWLWHVAAPPSLLPDGTVDPRFIASLRRVGRLGRLATALDQVRGQAVTMVPTPETIAALRTASAKSERAAAILGRIRNAAASPDAAVLAGAYTTVDGPSLESAGLGDAFARSLSTGRVALESTLDSAIDRTVAPPQPLDAPALSRLRTEAGTARVVVRASELTEADAPDQFTAARPFQLDTAVGPFQAVEVNDLASTLLVQNGDDALRAQQLLAGLTVVALEQPNRLRGVVIDSPLLWSPSSARVRALATGLRDNPVLELTGIGDIFGAVPAATVRERAYTRQLAPVPRRVAPVGRSRYADVNQRLRAFASMVPTDDPQVAALREQLLLGLASGTRNAGRAVSRERLDSVDAQIDAIATSVAAPVSKTITLTSRKASVPLSIENDSGRVLRVRVSLSSQKLSFPQGADRVVALRPGKNRTVQFNVEARASGTFPVVIDLHSPDDQLELQRVRYTVRSSVSNVGVLLTVGAALFLGLWWITHWRRSRRRPTPTDPTPSEPAPAGPKPTAPAPAT